MKSRYHPRIVDILSGLLLLTVGIGIWFSVDPLSAQTITSCEEVYQVMNSRDLDGADEELGRRAGTALSVQCLAQRYGPRWANTGYMKQGDHRYALIVLLGREPTYLEVFDSWIIQGSTNINAARNKTGYDITGRPTGFDGWNVDQQRLAVYVKLYGASRGSRILDGKDRDPDPAKAAELLALWRGVEPIPIPIPVPAPTPNPAPVPTPTPNPAPIPSPSPESPCTPEVKITTTPSPETGAKVICTCTPPPSPSSSL